MTENPDHLKTWQARAIGILTFGGSVLGCGLMVYFGVGAWPQILPMTIVTLFAIVFGYGVYLGVQILRGADKALEKAIPFWALQIPAIGSDFFSYNLCSGAGFWLSINSEWSLQFFWMLGSYATLTIGMETPASVGVNVFAVAVVVMLVKQKRAKLTAASTEQQPNPVD